ncbi:MAG: hypothetical protein FWG68_04985 [Defluviitaleaceae bacterium]|nr:hypothetical protein [Defluviitaleaceae bacterium]
MAFSYLMSLEELSVLAYFSEIDEFLLMPELPTLNEEQSEIVINQLSQKGMMHINKNNASVDLIVHYILTAMAQAAAVQGKNNKIGYCGNEIFVAVAQDKYSNYPKYRITPLQSKRALFAEIGYHEEETEITTAN